MLHVASPVIFVFHCRLGFLSDTLYHRVIVTMLPNLFSQKTLFLRMDLPSSPIDRYGMGKQYIECDPGLHF